MLSVECLRQLSTLGLPLFQMLQYTRLTSQNSNEYSPGFIQQHCALITSVVLKS